MKNIITHILQSHGFDAYEKDGVIYGEKDEQIVSVGIFDNITISELRSYSKKIMKQPGNHIICVLESSSTLEDEAHNLGLILWKKGDLEKEIGNVIIKHIERSGDSAFNDLLSGNRDMGTGQIILDTMGTEGKPLIVKSKLTVEDVKEISGNTIKGFKYELEYVPHYIFQYSCEYEGKDGQIIQKNGTISINALTGRYSEWKHKPEMASATEHILQLEPKIDQENAKKIAYHAIITLNTEFKEIIIERDHATIIEKVTFKPDAENITLENYVVIMVPVWCAEGKHGVMILDGITGKVISEDYYEMH